MSCLSTSPISHCLVVTSTNRPYLFQSKLSLLKPTVYSPFYSCLFLSWLVASLGLKSPCVLCNSSPNGTPLSEPLPWINPVRNFLYNIRVPRVCWCFSHDPTADLVLRFLLCPCYATLGAIKDLQLLLPVRVLWPRTAFHSAEWHHLDMKALLWIFLSFMSSLALFPFWVVAPVQ